MTTTIVKKLMLKKEEKELLKKATYPIWDIDKIDSEKDIAENILGLGTFKKFGKLVARIADYAGNKQ